MKTTSTHLLTLMKVEKEHCPWDDWNDCVQELDSSNANCIVCSPSASAIPRMPLGEEHPSKHRARIDFPSCLDSLCVARLVWKVEIDRTPAAKASMQKEWGRLRSRLVWDEQNPRGWDDVRSEDKRGGTQCTWVIFWNLL